MKFDLVFEGGGAKGMVFVGAYEEFVKQGHTHGRLLGTSAGAITAALLAAGYTAGEMLDALNERENGKPVFAGFMGPPEPFTKAEIRASAVRGFLHNINLKFVPDPLEDRIDDAIAEHLAEKEGTRHLFSFVERGGWYGADRFMSWLKEKLDSGLWNGARRAFGAMTLEQLFVATGVELSVVASDTTDGRMLVLNHHTSPNCPVIWAVRMSMSIPLVWNEVLWEKEWGDYLGRDLTDHAVVDGGLLSNFPIELFISNEPQVTRLMGPRNGNPVLGLLIDETLPVPQPGVPKGLLVDIAVSPGELRTVERLTRLINTATTAHDKMVMEEFEHLVVRLPAQGYGTTEFDMSDERRTALVEAARLAMGRYLSNRPMPRALPGRPAEPTATERLGEVATRMAIRLLRL